MMLAKGSISMPVAAVPTERGMLRCQVADEIPDVRVDLDECCACPLAVELQTRSGIDGDADCASERDLTGTGLDEVDVRADVERYCCVGGHCHREW